MGTAPSVAAIVVNLNSAKLLERCLQSLADQTFPRRIA
jgi:GT2 family glycosyltransferase